MIDLKVTIENDKVVVAGLQDHAARFPGAIKRGLRRVAAGIFARAFDQLSGPGGEIMTTPSGAGRRSRKIYDNSGSYPVPIRTGHLRRSLAWLNPGESKSGDLGTFKAGDDEVVVFDSASYAAAIFLGRRSSKSYGPRDALRDALEMFNRGAMIQQVIGEEIRKEINKA